MFACYLRIPMNISGGNTHRVFAGRTSQLNKWEILIMSHEMTCFFGLRCSKNAKSQACDTANEHALICTREPRHAAAVRQLSNGTSGDDLYMRIATV